MAAKIQSHTEEDDVARWWKAKAAKGSVVRISL